MLLHVLYIQLTSYNTDAERHKSQVAHRLGRRTFDQAVAGSTPGRGVIKSPRSTQSSIPLGVGKSSTSLTGRG